MNCKSFPLECFVINYIMSPSSLCYRMKFEYVYNMIWNIFLKSVTCSCRGVTNCCQISYTPTEILFDINEITIFLKSEIKKIGMETRKIGKSCKFMFLVMLKDTSNP